MKKIVMFLVLCCLMANPAWSFTIEDTKSHALLESLIFDPQAEVNVCIRWYPRGPAGKTKHLREQCFEFSKEYLCGDQLDGFLVWPDFTNQEPEPELTSATTE